MPSLFPGLDNYQSNSFTPYGPTTTPAAPQKAAPPNANRGGTKMWANLAKVGVALKTKADTALQSRMGKQVKGYAQAKLDPRSTLKTAGDTLKSLVEAPKGLAKDFATSVNAPRNKTGASNIIKLQGQFQSAVKQGRVSQPTQKLLRQVNNPDAKIKVYQMVSRGAPDKQVQQFLLKQQQAQTNKVKRVSGEGAGTIGLLASGEEVVGDTGVALTKQGFKAGTKSLLKGALRETPGGVLMGAGGQLQEKPTSSIKELAKAAGVGGIEAGLTHLGVKIAGRAGHKLATKDFAIGARDTSKSLTKAVEGKPLNQTEQVLSRFRKPSTAKSAALAVEKTPPKELVERIPYKNATPSEQTFRNIKMASAKGDAKSTLRSIHEWFNPAPGKQGAQVQRDLRSAIGNLNQKKVRAEDIARHATAEFSKLTPQDHLKFIQNIDTGAKQATPALEKLSGVLKKFNEGNAAIAKSLKPDLSMIENYTTHSGILDMGNAKSFANRWSKIPFASKPGALKERAFPTVNDMLSWANDKGIAVRETNPMTLALNSRAGLLKAKMAEDFKATQELKGVDPELVQKVIDRYMEPGLASHPVYKTVRQAANALNNLQLGLSGFHFTGTSLNAAFSEFANGLQKLSSGHPLKAGASVIRTAYAPADYAVGGHRFIQDIVTGADTHFTHAARIANFNPVKNNQYVATGFKQSLKDLTSGHIIRGVATAIPRAVSSASKPLMEHWVPDLKAGAFKRGIETADTMLGKDATIQERQAAYQKVADSIDNRFGQLNQDNLFWHKTMKDIGTVSMRSPGWNIGTVREIGGGIKDIPGSLKSLAQGKGISQRTAYTASLVTGTMLIGATMQRLFTGHGPTEIMDYFYPKTGKTDKNGNPERLSLPTYSKDIFSFMHSPGSTITNKVNPLLATGSELVKNKDYFGNEIRNPQDNFITQAQQAGKFIGKNVLPFSVSNTTQRVENTLSTKVQTFLGVNPAPGYITKSKLAQDIQTRLNQSKGQASLTPEDQALSQLKAQASADLKAGRTDSPNLQQLRTKMSDTSFYNFLKTGREDQVQKEFDSLPAEQKLKLVESYSPEQLGQVDMTSLVKSFVDNNAVSNIQTLKGKGFTDQQLSNDLHKAIESNQLKRLKAQAKQQAAK